MTLMNDLLGDPDRRWVFRDTELHDPATVMAEDYEAVQQPKRCGRDNKEIHRRQATDMVFEERAPGLRWRFGMLKDVPAYRPFRDLEAQLQQLTMNAWVARPLVADHRSIAYWCKRR